jgi:hypothetical protein
MKAWKDWSAVSVVSHEMDISLSKVGHHIEVEYGSSGVRHVVRCSCGWEQSAGGWMLESAPDEIRRLIAEHMAGVTGPLSPAKAKQR